MLPGPGMTGHVFSCFFLGGGELQLSFFFFWGGDCKIAVGIAWLSFLYEIVFTLFSQKGLQNVPEVAIALKIIETYIFVEKDCCKILK